MHGFPDCGVGALAKQFPQFEVVHSRWQAWKHLGEGTESWAEVGLEEGETFQAGEREAEGLGGGKDRGGRLGESGSKPVRGWTNEGPRFGRGILCNSL